MPALDTPAIDTDILEEEINLTNQNTTEKIKEAGEETFNRYDVMQYPVEYVRGYLRLRFEIPRTYNDITVLPQGIIVAIPEGGYANSHETGLYLCFDDHGRVETQRMLRQRPETKDGTPGMWEARGPVSLLRETKAIPATLQKLSEDINWSTSERTKFQSTNSTQD